MNIDFEGINRHYREQVYLKVTSEKYYVLRHHREDRRMKK